MKNPSKIAAVLTATASVALLLATSASAEDRPRDETWRGQRDAQHDTNRGDARSDSRDGRYRNDNNGTRTETRSEAYRNESRNNDTYRNESRNNYRNESRNDNYRNGSRNDGYRGQSRNEGYRGGDRDGHLSYRGRVRSFTHERDGYRVFLDGDSRSYWVPASALGRHRLSVGLDIRLGGVFRDGGIFVDALGYPGDPYYNDPYYGGGYYDNGYLTGRVERVDYRDGRLLLRDDRSGRVIDVDMRSVDPRYRRLDLGDVRPGDRLSLSGSWDGGWFRAYRIDGVSAY